ncbi:biotin transporter BioY [Chelativorans intermedius]|uniref:Biotin transporter n=1 Tax=Chelativorans intermedius TaxID=515947 RepID=A0ABV6D8B8_9HYPH|nr:biotin transporter BioY [Chelativorans intermedius]MCT8996808.1 biotin transporter BioY [Chelativorans intermedius]
MPTPSVQGADAHFSPLRLEARSLPVKLLAVLIGTLFLTLSSYITVPMVPVPITMQTFAVMMVGALYGWRLGTATILAWLAEGVAGLPILAGGAGGLAHFMGPTGGYILSWPLMAAFVGWLAERGWNGERPLLAFLSMLIAGTFCLVAGATWLAGFVGAEKAVTLGVLPFLLGDALKAALGAATLAAIVRTGNWWRSE